jgi:hypothetical protein
MGLRVTIRLGTVLRGTMSRYPYGYCRIFLIRKSNVDWDTMYPWIPECADGIRLKQKKSGKFNGDTGLGTFPVVLPYPDTSND